MVTSLAEPNNRIAGNAGVSPAPVKLNPLQGVDLSARYHSDRWGGDFFDAITADLRVVFLLTDIAGTRMEAHSIAAEVQLTFREKASALFTPPEANESVALSTLAHDINRSLMEAAGGVRYAPTFLGCFNRALGVLTYYNAGRVFSAFRDARSVQLLAGDGVPFGLFTHATYEPATLAFEPQDTLLLVTKGVTESRRGTREFGAQRIENILQQASGDSASKLCDTVLREAYEYANHPWSRFCDFLFSHRTVSQDDMTAVVLVRSQPAAM